MGAIRNSLRFSDDIRQRFLSLEELWPSHISVHSQITGRAVALKPAECIPSEKCLLEFQPEVSPEWKHECPEWTTSVRWSFIPLGLNQLYVGSWGIFFCEWWILWWLWNARLVYPSLTLSLSLSLFLSFPPVSFSFLRPRLLWNGLFFFPPWSIWPKCLWLDLCSWCKRASPFALVPWSASQLPALECLCAHVYGGTFKQQPVGPDCLGFMLSLLWWLILSQILIT